MNINTNNLVFNKDSFYLNDDNVPSNQNKFHDGLTYLANKALEALKQPEEVEWAFQQIEKLNTQKLSSNNTNTQIQTVFQKWHKIQFGDKSRYIPKEHLQKFCGKKFQGQFTTNMKDKSSRTLEISPPEGVNISDIPAVVREGFLSYLQTGVVSDDAVEENVMSLMDLAYQHQLDSFVEQCSSIIQANIDDENLEIVFEFTKNRHLPSLRWACIGFIHTHSIDLTDKLTDEDRETLNLLAQRDTIKLKMSPEGKWKVTVTQQLEDSDIDHLEKINNKFPISSVYFLVEQKDGLSFINEIIQKFENIEELIINDPSFSPHQYIKIQKQFPKLTAFGNDVHTLSNFYKVKVYLEQFRNPDVEDASSKKLTLRSLNLSAIRDLTDAQLEELTPYLQEIYHLSINSDKITKLIAPKATIVNCYGCTNLETLEANQADLICIRGCKSLKTLQANQTNKVYCQGCTGLETLQANQAEKVDCSGSTSLKTLQANQAKVVDCDGCTSLETLQANNAEKVYCRGCTSLKTLQANQAEKVICRGCTSLETLRANQAKIVYCRGCTNLETLEANQAKEVYCDDCTSLKTLQANQAKEVYYDGCTSLKTLQANQAEKVYCEGCTNLETFEANQAIRIYCNGCINLETLDANQAKTIYCYDCTNLKIFGGSLSLLPFNIAIRVLVYRFYLWVYHLFTDFIDLFRWGKR